MKDQYIDGKSINIYGTMNKPHVASKGRPRRLDVVAIRNLLRRYPWAYQDELVTFLEEQDIKRPQEYYLQTIKEGEDIVKREGNALDTHRARYFVMHADVYYGYHGAAASHSGRVHLQAADRVAMYGL